MWAKNLLFLSICLVGGAMLVASVLPPRGDRPRPAVPLDGDSVREAAAKVDAAFERQWHQAGVEPATHRAGVTHGPADVVGPARHDSFAGGDPPFREPAGGRPVGSLPGRVVG